MFTVSSADRHTAVYTLTTVTTQVYCSSTNTEKFPNYANEMRGLLDIRLKKKQTK